MQQWEVGTLEPEAPLPVGERTLGRSLTVGPSFSCESTPTRGTNSAHVGTQSGRAQAPRVCQCEGTGALLRAVCMGGVLSIVSLRRAFGLHESAKIAGFSACHHPPSLGLASHTAMVLSGLVAASDSEEGLGDQGVTVTACKVLEVMRIS